MAHFASALVRVSYSEKKCWLLVYSLPCSSSVQQQHVITRKKSLLYYKGPGSHRKITTLYTKSWHKPTLALTEKSIKSSSRKENRLECMVTIKSFKVVAEKALIQHWKNYHIANKPTMLSNIPCLYTRNVDSFILSYIMSMKTSPKQEISLPLGLMAPWLQEKIVRLHDGSSRNVYSSKTRSKYWWRLMWGWREERWEEKMVRGIQGVGWRHPYETASWTTKMHWS